MFFYALTFLKVCFIYAKVQKCIKYNGSHSLITLSQPYVYVIILQFMENAIAACFLSMWLLVCQLVVKKKLCLVHMHAFLNWILVQHSLCYQYRGFLVCLCTWYLQFTFVKRSMRLRCVKYGIEFSNFE